MTHRRGNGLLADTYVPLILLPPALADLMLDALRHAGIAAYAIPLDEDVLKPGDSSTKEPPTDHLYVDSTERGTAEEILRTELPELEGRTIEVGRTEAAANADSADTGPRESAAPGDPADPRAPDRAASSADDDVWADLVARFYDSDGPGSAPAWPDAENVSAPKSGGNGGDLLAPEPGDTAADDAPDEPAPRSGAPARRDSGDDDHYIPPPPPPLPRGDLVSRLSWAGLFGGPLVLLVSTLLGLRIPDVVAFLAVAAFIAGFVVLVVRMGDRPPRDSGPDDGAVI